MKLSDENIRGKTAISADGQVLGEVTAVNFDSLTWRVEALRLELRKDIADRVGADRTIFHAGAVHVPIDLVQSVGDTVVLNSKVDELRKLIPVE